MDSSNQKDLRHKLRYRWCFSLKYEVCKKLSRWLHCPHGKRASPELQGWRNLIRAHLVPLHTNWVEPESRRVSHLREQVRRDSTVEQWCIPDSQINGQRISKWSVASKLLVPLIVLMPWGVRGICLRTRYDYRINSLSIPSRSATPYAGPCRN